MNLATPRSVLAPSAFGGIAAVASAQLLNTAALGLPNGLILGAIAFGVAASAQLTVLTVRRFTHVPLLASRQTSEIIIELPLREATAIAREALESIGARVRHVRSIEDDGETVHARLPMGRSHWGAGLRDAGALHSSRDEAAVRVTVDALPALGRSQAPPSSHGPDIHG